jgi:hypothetical protein
VTTGESLDWGGHVAREKMTADGDSRPLEAHPGCMLALLLTALLALPAAPEDIPTAAGQHFRVRCHGFASAEFAGDALRAVEALWPHAAELYGLPKESLKKRLEVNLYRRESDYQRVNQELTSGEFTKNLAFAHFDTRSAHVALQPPCSDELLAEFGVPAQTLRLLVHEAAHLARYEAHNNFRSHPDWVAHGAASWIDQMVMEEVGRSSPLADPWSSKTVLRVQTLLEEERLPGAAAIFRGELQELEFYDRYSVTEVFFRYLRSNKDVPLKGMLQALRRLAGGGDFNERYYAEVEALLGKSWEQELDAGFEKYLRELEPEWDHVLRSLSPQVDGYLQVAFPETNSVAFRRTGVGEGDFRLSGRLRILPARASQMNLLLGRRERGFVSVAINAGYGLTVFDYDGALWNRIGGVKVEGIGVGEQLTFQAQLTGDTLVLTINETEALRIDAGQLDLSGAWGLGAQAGSAGLWQDLAVD